MVSRLPDTKPEIERLRIEKLRPMLARRRRQLADLLMGP